MGVPYNSPADDLYYVEAPKDKGNAYLVSNRLGSIYIKNPTCCDDIYRVIKNPNLSVKGRVIDAATNEVLEKVVVKLNDDNTSNTVDTFFSGNGAFMFKTPVGKNYTVTADKAGYTTGRASYSTASKTAADPDEESVVDIYVNKITSDYTFHVQNVYYDFDLHQYQPSSYKALDTLSSFMKDNPSLSVEVYANTDGKGSDEYNQDLSTKRAEEVINYLVSKGVERARMIARPQAANVKAAPNEKDGAGKDNPEARALNRRTYFRIIGDSEGKRIIYDNNRPDYIDKTGESQRTKNLEVKENEEADQGTIPSEAKPK
jgi:OmpA-OmpF porin, OOP family